LSSSADTQPVLKRECHSKPLYGLKNVLQSLMKHFKGFGSRFIELHAKLDADMLLDLPFISDKTKHEVEKSLV
jgi:hypothetical protein